MRLLVWCGGSKNTEYRLPYTNWLSVPPVAPKKKSGACVVKGLPSYANRGTAVSPTTDELLCALKILAT